MRYVFIVNPAAGKKNPYSTVFPRIQEYFGTSGLEYTCHITNQPRQATELVKQQGAKRDEVRIFAVGGDGTLSEVAAGAIGMKNVEVGVIPCGSGNDYVRTFGNQDAFLSLDRQLRAKSRAVDMIESNGRFSINLCSIGLDAKVGYEMNRFKNWPFLTGSMAYDFAVVKVLFGKIGEHLKIMIDGEKEFEGDYLFALAGSGKYYGGGYCGAPKAIPDDGLLDFVLIKKPPLTRIPSLINLYKAGKHFESPKFEDILTFCRGKEMCVSSFKPIIANYDGECRAMEHACFKVVPNSIRFIVPE